MIRNPFNLGDGHVYRLNLGDDLDQAPASLRKLISIPLKAAFQTFPSVFHQASERATIPSFRTWLIECAKGHCSLLLFDTEHFGQTALLEVRLPGTSLPALLDFRTPKSRTRAFPPSAPSLLRPKHIPDPLAEVYACVGGIQHQFGASGSIIPPDALKPLRACWMEGQVDTTGADLSARAFLPHVAEGVGLLQKSFAEQGLPTEGLASLDFQAMAQNLEDSFASGLKDNPLEFERWTSTCPGIPSAERLGAMIPFYEDSGDFLCFEPSGDSIWIGWETGGVMPFGSVHDALDAFFASWLDGRPFKTTFRPVST